MDQTALCILQLTSAAMNSGDISLAYPPCILHAKNIILVKV